MLQWIFGLLQAGFTQTASHSSQSLSIPSRTIYFFIRTMKALFSSRSPKHIKTSLSRSR